MRSKVLGILKIERKAMSHEYIFMVTLNTGTMAEVEAKDLLAYERFQSAVLTQTGQLFSWDLLERRDNKTRRDWWISYIGQFFDTQDTTERRT